MKDLSILHIALIYLAVTNVVTFFMYGVDKWKAKKSKWRIRETALLGLAVLGGSIGAWLGMKAEGEHYDYLARITKIQTEL